MSVLIVLVILSVIVAGTFLYLFVMSVKKGQFDDDYTPSVRMLFDDGPAGISNSEYRITNIETEPPRPSKKP